MDKGLPFLAATASFAGHMNDGVIPPRNRTPAFAGVQPAAIDLSNFLQCL
jgi:hypothetical protein